MFGVQYESNILYSIHMHLLIHTHTYIYIYTCACIVGLLGKTARLIGHHDHVHVPGECLEIGKEMLREVGQPVYWDAKTAKQKHLSRML